MIDGLLSLFRHRHPPEAAPAVKEATTVRDAQFEEWGNVMHEVERVQTIAAGKPRHAKASR